jgi:hypothetical protein
MKTTATLLLYKITKNRVHMNPQPSIKKFRNMPYNKPIKGISQIKLLQLGSFDKKNKISS